MADIKNNQFLAVFVLPLPSEQKVTGRMQRKAIGNYSLYTSLWAELRRKITGHNAGKEEKDWLTSSILGLWSPAGLSVSNASLKQTIMAGLRSAIELQSCLKEIEEKKRTTTHLLN